MVMEIAESQSTNDGYSTARGWSLARVASSKPMINKTLGAIPTPQSCPIDVKEAAGGKRSLTAITMCFGWRVNQCVARWNLSSSTPHPIRGKPNTNNAHDAPLSMPTAKYVPTASLQGERRTEHILYSAGIMLNSPGSPMSIACDQPRPTHAKGLSWSEQKRSLCCRAAPVGPEATKQR